MSEAGRRDVDPIEGQRFDVPVSQPAYTTHTGVPAGPESAAEHIKNALQVLQGAEQWGARYSGDVNADRVLENIVDGGWVLFDPLEYDAVRARLARALAAIEGTER